MLVQEFQHVSALTRTQFIYMTGKAAIYVNDFTPGDGMFTDDRMNGFWILAARIKPPKGQHTVMGGGQSFQVFLHFIRKRIISRIHAGEDRIAPIGGKVCR